MENKTDLLQSIVDFEDYFLNDVID